jgi:DNA polymerase-4
LSTRWVLHVDMDAFFAAVEVKEDPSLAGKPLVVGGTGTRGVVASASYEARGFGVRSAMPGREARRLCPQLVFLPARFELYHGYSELLHAALKTFTPLVEGIGLDEAFLDVSAGASLFGTPAEIAAQVRERVSADLGLACSVGAGPNKLVAKLASKAAKPRASRRGPSAGPGAVVVTEDEVLDFIWPMPVEALWGVGPASRDRLHKVGVTTVGQLAALPEATVVAALGKAAGEMVHSLAWGRDGRAVVADRELKSIGHEETYPTDLVDRAELERRLVVLADSVAARVRRHGVVARTLTLKFRYGDFTTLTRSHTFATPQMSGPSLWTAAKELLGSLELREGVRLLGLSASGLVPVQSAPGEQLKLELGGAPTGSPGEAAPSQTRGGPEDPGGVIGTSAPGPRQAGNGPGPGWERASQAIDAVRARFGDTAVGPATSLGEKPRPPSQHDRSPSPRRGKPSRG